MRIKRFLALILVLSLIFSVTAPASAAVRGGEDSVKPGNTQNTTDSDRVVSGNNSNNANSLRDDLSGLLGHMGSGWLAEKVDLDLSLFNTKLPDCVQELKELSKTHGARERVSAFVVLDKAPLVNYYSSINGVPASAEEKAQQWQDAVITTIEEDVLDGEELTVVTRFSYLTNAIVVETEFENLEQIALLKGVRTVFLTPVFYPCATTEADKMTVSSGQMSDVDDVWNLNESGYTGEGMLIAILDTGLDLDHPSFEAAPAGAAWSQEDIADMLDTLDLNAEELFTMSTGKILSASRLYYNEKIPFTFNYSMGTTNVSHADGIGDHGTHVAGISAANKVENTGVVGMAPDAQIIAMKVFNSNTGGANMYDILNALEDCIKLGVDVANLSLGSPAGFTSSGAAIIDEIFANINKTDLIVDVAAGNEGTSSYGSLWGTNLQPTDHIDNATISSPSTYANAMAIGSVDNNYVAADYFALADGTKVFYQPSVEYLYEYTDIGMIETLADQPTEYVFVPGLGEEADFYDENGNSIVEGKIAVIHRGTISFSEKAANAEAAGAVAALIWNNESENIYIFGMSIEAADGSYPGIPVVLISLEDGQLMEQAEDKTLTVSAISSLRIDVNGGQMSNFSCWGVSPNLGLLPDLSGVGGNIFSCYDNGYYGLMSGTSMATPQVAGVTALVLQYLRENFDLTETETRILADALMMSTAVPVIDNRTGLEASPRQQGAGLVNALNAVTTKAYLSVPGSDRPKAELGDSEDGVYSFTFTVHNFGEEAITYALRSSLLCEDFITVEEHPGVYFMAEADHGLDNSAVTFDSNTVTVPAGGTATVSVSINLTEADKEWINTYFANGNYVEGFIYLTAEGEVTLSLPFLGFYGSWYDAPVFDEGFWYDEGFWDLTDEVDSNEYYHMLWTSLGVSNEDYALGLNPYGTIETDENGNIIYSSHNNVLSPNGDGVLDMVSDYYLSLMRNARWVILTYTDKDGNVLDEEYLDLISKTMFISGFGATVPFVYSWYYDDLYDFTDANGNYLPHGTELTLTVSGVLDYGEEDRITDSFQIPIYIDTEAPVLDTDKIVEISNEEGNFLSLTFTDEHPAYVALLNKSGSQLYGSYTDTTFTDNGDGSYSVLLDVTGLGNNFSVAICDYGCNEAYYELTYTQTENNPVMDTTALYAYQCYNEYIHAYYGWDYMFGWATLDKETGYAEMISSDAYEYYALTAAEYAGGYIFAVDAGYNLIYMVPGLWNRNVICNLGLNVVDMAFDETTDTMYLAVKDNKNEAYGLYTVDLLTGELTLLKSYSTYYNMPWSMTFVDGNLYACRYYYSGFYQVDIAGGTYELTHVKGADGEDYYPKTAAGNQVSPDFVQSMTYSKADGVIYWAYYDGSSCELLTIDPKTWTNTAAVMDWDQDFIGVLTLEDDGYVLPESQDVTKLIIPEDDQVLPVGDWLALSAITLPWNAPAPQIVWTSSDENIAYVDETGVVIGISEGVATITATCGDLSVSRTVTVLDVSGSIYLYDYYTGDGDYGAWQNLDLQTMETVDMGMSPVDFLAADYNGHEGKIYGFDEFGQAYKYDPYTGECQLLGDRTGLLVSDMAYDYSTGTMYAIVYDTNNWKTTIYAMSMGSGKLVKVGSVSDVLITLACDGEGQLYTISYDGILYSIRLPRSASGSARLTEIMQTPLETVYYGQTMCYDHNNDVIIWNSPEYGTIFWLAINEEEPYAVSLGDPSGTGVIEVVGMFSIPDEIEELPYKAVTKIEASDMLLLVDDSKSASVTTYPVNATNQTDLTLVSADESIAKVVNGRVLGVKEGVTTITATLNDNGKTFTCSFEVTVKVNTDNIFGYLMTDLSNYDGYYTLEISDEDPKNYEPLEFIYTDGVYMCLYSAEYVAETGYVYAYGYNPDDWSANFHFLTINPRTWAVVDAIDMGDGFPFVYDMAFDYTTGTMYALAGSQSATDLYVVNMADGTLIESVLTAPMFMSLAIDANGTIYAMAASESDSDMMDASATLSNAILYTIDPARGTYKQFLDTGVTSNMLASMAYDFDTGNIYWTALDSKNNSGLYLIDLEEKAVCNLGAIGSAGAQVTALMIFADEYPKVPDTLQTLSLMTTMLELLPGNCAQLDTLHHPVDVDAQLTWTSSDESVATVDENGVVTAVSAGHATVTVTAYDGTNTLTATCKVFVYGVEDYFLTYNLTDGGFSSITRSDSVTLDNLNQGDDGVALDSMTWVNGTIYAYDEEGKFFTASAEDGYIRHYLGDTGIELAEDEVETSGYTTYVYHNIFTVRDLAWDPAGNRLLALGCFAQEVFYSYESGDYSNSYSYMTELRGGCRVYEVDLETGALKELCTVGGEGNSLSGVCMLTVTNQGQPYVFSTYMDYMCKLDLETGAVTNLSTLQNQGFYVSPEGEAMSMVYDKNTNTIYMLITEDGVTYYLYTFNVATTAMSCVGQVNVDGDLFAGLAIVSHVHTFEDGFCTGCGEPEYTLGDVDGNGEVDLLDANLAVGYYNETADLTDVQLLAADVDGNGEVDLLDANLIVGYYNETVDVFPAQ